MSDAAEPTEPIPAAEPAARTAPPPPPPVERRPARPGVTLPWWALAVGVVACLLLGSALTFVGVRANDDGEFRPALARLEQRGPGGGRFGGPGFGGPGPEFGGPGSGPRGGFREDGDEDEHEDEGQDEQDGQNQNDDESPSTTDSDN